MSIVINANSCRVTDSRNLSGAHDFLRAKILKSSIFSRGNTRASILFGPGNLAKLMTKGGIPNQNLMKTIHGHLESQKTILFNIKNILDQLNSGLPDDLSDYNLLNDSDGELCFLCSRVAYLTSQLLTEEQLVVSFRIASGVAHGAHSQSARDAVDAFSQLLWIMKLPKIDAFIDEISCQFSGSVRSIKIDQLRELLAKTETFLQKYTCLGRELSLGISTFIEQVQLSFDGLLSNANLLPLRNSSSEGAIDSHVRRTTETHGSFCLDTLNLVTNSRVTSESLKVTQL